jgi:hypothetical protein
MIKIKTITAKVNIANPAIINPFISIKHKN